MPSPDRMGPKRKSIFLGYQEGIRGLISSGAASASTGVGDAPEAEVAALSAVGLHMDASDEHDWFWVIPRDLNITQEIGFRVRYSSASATAADTRSWIILYDIIPENSAIALGTTALSTIIALLETDNGTANAWQESARGVLNGDTVTEANLTTQAIMAINLELDSDAASEEMNMYGLMIDYVPKRYLGEPVSWNPAYDRESK